MPASPPVPTGCPASLAGIEPVGRLHAVVAAQSPPSITRRSSTLHSTYRIVEGICRRELHAPMVAITEGERCGFSITPGQVVRRTADVRAVDRTKRWENQEPSRVTHSLSVAGDYLKSEGTYYKSETTCLATGNPPLSSCWILSPQTLRHRRPTAAPDAPGHGTLSRSRDVAQIHEI